MLDHATRHRMADAAEESRITSERRMRQLESAEHLLQIERRIHSEEIAHWKKFAEALVLAVLSAGGTLRIDDRDRAFYAGDRWRRLELSTHEDHANRCTVITVRDPENPQ